MRGHGRERGSLLRARRPRRSPPRSREAAQHDRCRELVGCARARAAQAAAALDQTLGGQSAQLAETVGRCLDHAVRCTPACGARKPRRQDCDESRPRRADRLLIKPAAGAGRRRRARTDRSFRRHARSGQSPEESHAARQTPGWQRSQTDRPAESHSPPSPKNGRPTAE